ncbi:unnamed protein product [Tilletia laevis]|uniref:Uncharacterized protein n=3 Tax=Tilletia TaxID=13289 RepID=A0A8X7SY27_9BASI|nr:hypothetical protein CF336_g319 [Tilletia laevis]KAE8205657.1 hypothetical protein CF328_g362 [Tilletia controversa]KAE8265499.1 hypothetical protein A4X03_0g218 [Tilletia caries]KAE8206730.1 hypothetical protein CF335_g1659 [Tilletia laevis]KAE8251092.1 hypothetical protein A4X06_0g2819 [Tilletia controversa]
MASSSALLTENNLRALASGASTAHTVLDFVAGQAALIPTASLPKDKVATLTADKRNANEEDGHAHMDDQADRRRPQSPMLEARTSAKRRAEPEHDRSADDRSLDDDRVLKTRSKEKRATSEKKADKETEREKREVEERLQQRKERRQAKALIVRDSSTTAAQKIRQKNSQKKGKKRAESESSISFSEDEDDSGDAKRKKKMKQKKKGKEKEDSNSLKTARKRNLTNLAAMELLDKPKSITKERRITLAPKTGVFNKGVASRKSKVPTADLVFSELKFFNKDGTRQPNGEDSTADEDEEVREDTEAASMHSAHSNRLRRAKEAGSSRFFKRNPSRASVEESDRETDEDGGKVSTRRPKDGVLRATQFRSNSAEEVEQDDDRRIGDGHQRHTERMDACQQGPTYSPSAHKFPEPELALPVQPRSSSWHAAEPTFSNEPSSAFPTHSYLTDLCPTQPANAWRRDHHIARPERQCAQHVQPRLYASQSTQQAPHFRGDVLEPSRVPLSHPVARSFPPMTQHTRSEQMLGMPGQVGIGHDDTEWTDHEHQPSQIQRTYETGHGDYRACCDVPTESAGVGHHYDYSQAAGEGLYDAQGQPRNLPLDFPQGIVNSHTFTDRYEPLLDDRIDCVAHPEHMLIEPTYPNAFASTARQVHYAEEDSTPASLQEPLPSWRMTYDEDSEVSQHLRQRDVSTVDTNATSCFGAEPLPRADEDILGVTASQLQSFWEPFRT